MTNLTRCETLMCTKESQDQFESMCCYSLRAHEAETFREGFTHVNVFCTLEVMNITILVVRSMADSH